MKYYEINEKIAKAAHNMISMSDYKAGSTTETYRNEVDEVYKLAEEVANEKPNRTEDLMKLADRYSRKLAEYYNKEASIGTRCPSILIAGAGNFPTRKKEKQLQSWEQNHKFYEEIQKIKNKILAIKNGKEVIKSGDADALEKLKEKLDEKIKLQEKMKAINKALRMKDESKKDAKLLEILGSEKNVAKAKEPDACGRVGFTYQLMNNNSEIRRLKNRIAKLEAVKENGSREEENENFKIVMNSEIMRVQIIFKDKPSAEVRGVLKNNGFRWAPSQNAWQRQWTKNAEYALDKVKEVLMND